MIVTTNDDNESVLSILTDFIRLQRDKLRASSDKAKLQQARIDLAQEAEAAERRLASEVVAELEA